MTYCMPPSIHKANTAELFRRGGNFPYLTQAKKIDLFWKVPLKIHQAIVSGVGVSLIWFELWQYKINTVNK